MKLNLLFKCKLYIRLIAYIMYAFELGSFTKMKEYNFSIKLTQFYYNLYTQ